MSSPNPTNSESIDIYVFGCGHGDTILLRLPGHEENQKKSRWVLVDCFLPVSDGTRDRFFDFVGKQEIDRLDYIFQTHPDYDHFHGMIDVLDYFTRDGRTLGIWGDIGFSAKEVKALIWDPKSRYEELQQKVDELFSGRYARIDEHSTPITPKGWTGRICFVPVAPTADDVRNFTRKDVSKLAQNQHSRLEANKLSILLVLSVKLGDHSLNVFLGADAEIEQTQAALERWHTFADENDRVKGFHVIKVPHHGSKISYTATLPASKAPKPPHVAAISAGNRKGCPDREVLDGYLAKGWTVAITTPRSLPASVGRRGHLPSGILSSMPATHVSQNIHIRWSESGELTWEPSDLNVSATDLCAY